jgi:preprotein translocase subunit SecD
MNRQTRIIVATAGGCVLLGALLGLWFNRDAFGLASWMSAGTRLTYEIVQEEGRPWDDDDLRQVIRSRVDPEGTEAIQVRVRDPVAVEVCVPHAAGRQPRPSPQAIAMRLAGVKRLLEGLGVLEFRIVAPMNTTEATVMRTRLLDKGPAPMPGDTSRWYEVDREDQLSHHELVEHAGKKWILISVRPEDSMANGPGLPVWRLERAYPETDPRRNKPVVGFEFDADGAKLFGQLTSTHINQPLAIILDDKVLSAPNIQSRIEKNGIITGDRSAQEHARLIAVLNAGVMPVGLRHAPALEESITMDVSRADVLSLFLLGSVGVVGLAAILYAVLRPSRSTPGSEA